MISTYFALHFISQINQWTAMFFAMQAKHHDVMKYLLDTKRIKLNHKDEVRVYLLATTSK